MIPNVTKDLHDTDKILMKCNCGGVESIEISVWHWGDGEPTDYLLSVINYPPTLWGAVVWWWKHRKVWASDITLSKADLAYLRDWLIANVK